MSIVASTHGYKKNHGLLRPWRSRQFTLLSDGWFLWDKEQSGTRGKCWDLVETVIGPHIVRINQYYTFTITIEDEICTIGFTAESEAKEWNDLMQEIADENAAGRREWTAGFRDALRAQDIRTRRELVLRIKPRDWNKEWQFCLRARLGDEFSMQIRRMKRMYGLWLQFNQYSLMLVDAILNSNEMDQFEIFPQVGLESWWDDPMQPKMTIYKYGPLIIKMTKDHWEAYKALKQDMRYLASFKELYDIFRTLATATIKGGNNEKYREVQQLKFPLVSTLEVRDMRVAVFAQPIGDAHPVGLINSQIHTILSNLRFTRPTQVLDALRFKELPTFSSIYRNTVSEDIYLMQIQSPFNNVLKSSLRPASLAGCYLSNDKNEPIRLLNEMELLKLKEELETNKKGLVHYLNLKGIKNKIELIPYLDLIYFSTDIISTSINTRATELICNKVYGDVIFTFNNFKIPLHLKELFLLDNKNKIKKYLSILNQSNTTSNTIEKYENKIKIKLNKLILDVATRLITLGDTIEEDATMTIQNTEMDLNSKDIIYVSGCRHLCKIMGKYGINLSFLPALLGCLNNTQNGIKIFIMSEIVSRIAKHYLRYQLLKKKEIERTKIAITIFNTIMEGLMEKSPNNNQFWAVEFPIWATLGPYSSSASILQDSVLDATIYHAKLRENPAPLYMALLHSLRLPLTSRVIKNLLENGNRLNLPKLDVKDVVSFQKSRIASTWSTLQQTDMTSFTQQLLQFEQLYNTNLMPSRHSTMRQTKTIKSKGEGYLELFRTVDERVAGALEGISDNVEEYGIERGLLANLHKALTFARSADAQAVRSILMDAQRMIELLPSHALIPVGVYLVMLFLEIFLVENETPYDLDSLIGVYIHAWRWLRLLHRPGNISQLFIEASSHMMSLVILVKLRNVLKKRLQDVGSQKFHAMLSLLIRTMPPWQDLSKLLEPNLWFKKVEQHFLSLQTMYLPKALIHEIQVIPPFNVNEPFWSTNGMAFLEGNVMGMSLDVEQRNLAQNQQLDSSLHAFTQNSMMRTIELNLLRFPLSMTCTIKSVACGYRHAALVSTRGDLFTLGYGECGRLGHGDENPVTHPQEVEFFDEIPVSQVSCGREHTMVITEDCRLFGFGWGEAGRLGTGESGKCLTPQQVSILPVSQVACGREHTLALTTSGQLLAFGAGYGGRCGVGTEDDVEMPTLVQADPSTIFVDMDAGECHSAAIDRDGNVYTWGFGGSGAMGRGYLDNDLVPALVPFLKAKSIGCGAYHTVAVLQDGTVYGWGDALAGQLGDIAVTLGEMRTSPHKISIPNVHGTVVSCGSFTTAVMTSNGQAYHWGSPEAGNGSPLNKQDACPRRVELPDGVGIGSVSCGAYQMIIATQAASFSYIEEEI